MLPPEIYLQGGVEPELVTSIGYASKSLSNKSMTRLGGYVKLAPLIFSDRSYKLNFFVSSTRQISDNGYLLFVQQIYYAHQSDRAGVMSGLGFELGVNPFWYGKRWTKAFEIAWQQTSLTHIRHSSATLSTFDDRYTMPNTTYAKNGWYHATANRFKFGFTTAKNLKNNLAFQFSFGSLIALQKQHILLGFAHAQVPLYLHGMIRYILK
jgi:hypothetical protein